MSGCWTEAAAAWSRAVCCRHLNAVPCPSRRRAPPHHFPMSSNDIISPSSVWTTREAWFPCGHSVAITLVWTVTCPSTSELRSRFKSRTC